MRNATEPTITPAIQPNGLHAIFATISPFNLAGIFLLVSVMGLALAYGIQAGIKPPAPPKASTFSAPLTAVNIGGQELIIPDDWIVEQSGRTGSFSDEMKLSLRVQFTNGQPPHLINVVLMPLSSVHPSAYLLDKVYLHQFQTEQRAGPTGLIGKPLQPRDGFENETVWYDPISANPFVAKCLDIEAADAKPRCLRTIRAAGSLAVSYEFEYSLLENYRNFDANLNPILKLIGAI